MSDAMNYFQRFGVLPARMVGINITDASGVRLYHVGCEPDLSGIDEDSTGEVYPWTMDGPLPCDKCGRDVL